MSLRNNGYIKLYRNITDWGWYSDLNTTRLFIHCILKANFIEKEWHGKKIPVGSFVTSYAKLAQELNLSVHSIRTAINRLKSTGEITYQGTNQNSIITVNNYLTYQKYDTQNDNQIANKSHAIGKQLATTNKRNKGIKEEYYSKKEIFKKLKEQYERDGHL